MATLNYSNTLKKKGTTIKQKFQLQKSPNKPVFKLEEQQVNCQLK